MNANSSSSTSTSTAGAGAETGANPAGPTQSMATPTSSSTPPATGTGTGTAAAASSDGSGKKVRKPYTITKSRESWTEEEHDKFLEALQLFDRDWKKIEDFVGSKTVIQIRVMPRNTFEGPKEWYNCACSSSLALNAKPLILTHRRRRKMIISTRGNFPAFLMACNLADSADTVSGLGTSSRTLPSAEMPKQGKQAPVLHGIPDFAEVYSFIGSVFDPDTKGHVEKLQEMDPINFETVLLLMRNLTVNLSSPDFEPYVSVNIL
ncbi:hypothetical protein H0E87_012695 [Populus deltoides]|uniref:MYB transcription factor n=1 Tax=Populus deltoides TaxID=3696 RepID=A0A8T2YK80_POPDE|nr:hypothetical protein H0E87_012695 [Populus deltoides]